jgi:hypothetical protein
MKVCTEQEPRSGTKKAMTRCLPKAAMIGSFGPTGPKFVAYSSALAGVTAAMTSAAQAMEVERSSWTIELVSFQFGPTHRESVCCNAQSNTALQCQICVAVRDNWSRLDSKPEGCGWADMKATTADDTFTGKGGSKRTP